ncbi:histidine kinase N-terminal domain-containing protein [Oceanobacillus locisalsi]|uniref:histidine kinase n=1 Tax=Oceanobacillus locisalsi TaxID=546107 RepID=A0ABW3NDD2_9BACI
MNKQKNKIMELCKKYTDMTEEEIAIIYQKSQALDELAAIFDCDIFIDVPLKNSTASIVIYHVLPVSKGSLYEQSPVGQPAMKMNEPGVWKVSRTGGKLKGYKAFTQENVFIRQNIYAIEYQDKILGTYIMEEPFHEMQDDTAEEQNDYMVMTARLNNYIDDAIYFFDASSKLIFQNEKADSILKDSLQDEVYYNQLFGDQIPYSELVLSDKNTVMKEIELADKFYMMKQIILEDDKLEFAIILRDITQLKNKEAEIISKTEAIRETHHRIKNNLQTMASLLRMEKRRSNNEEIKHILSDNMNRVMSIAATHDILARQLGDEVELSEVIKFIVNNMHRSYMLLNNLELSLDAEESIIVRSEIATSVSLIVNELVQNSYNHAFAGRNSGKLKVSLKKQGDTVIITVADNGIGFSIDEIKKNSLGLVIVQNYVKDKLKGTIQFNRLKRGMEVVIQFKQTLYDDV